MCKTDSGFVYVPDGTSTLDLGPKNLEESDLGQEDNILSSRHVHRNVSAAAMSQWRNAKILEIVLLPPSNEVELVSTSSRRAVFYDSKFSFYLFSFYLFKKVNG